MTGNPSTSDEDPAEEIVALVRQLQKTQQRLQELTGGELDSVTIPGGESYLLHAAQEKLLSSEQALQMRECALGEISQGVVFSDAQRLIVYANTGFEQITGYSEAELLGKNCAILQGPLTDPTTVKRMRANLDAGQPFEGEILNYRKDGTIFWNELSIAPVQSKQGEPAGFVGIQRDITERKHAEEALRQSLTLIRIAGRLTRTGGWTMELPSRQVLWSDEVCEIMDGLPGGSLALSEALALHPSPSRDDVAAALEACARDGTPFDKEVEILTIKGRRIWGHVCGEAERCDDGTIRRVRGAFQDITERKRAEEEVQSNEILLSEFIRHTPAAIAMLDTQMRYLQRSERWIQDYHLTGQDIIGKSHYEVFPEAPERWKEIHQRVLAGAVERCDEDAFPRANGSLDWLQWEARPWRKAGGEIGGLIFFTQVITERKEAEASLRESEERFRQMSERLKLAVRAGKIGIWDWDIAGGAMHWDDQMYELYGASPAAEPAGVDLWQRHLHPADQERANAEIASALDPAGLPFDTSFRIVVAPHAITRHVRAQGVVFRDAAGRATRMLGTNWDVTREVRREESLRRKLENEKTLRQQASAGEKAKSEFLAVMSHEIRTPMNGILGFADMLAEDADLSAESRGYVETIRGSGEALLHILNDVLDFSRIEAGRLKIDKVAMSPSALIGEIAALFALQIRENGLDFQSSVAGDVPPLVTADPGRTRQILVNLVGNAVKFTDRGSIRLGVRRSDARLEFFVHDSGAGIAADKIEEIFEPFTQEDSSTARQHGGVGLGLTISRRLAGLMGGELNVRSEPGHGSEFSLLIPLEPAETPVAIIPSKPLLTVPPRSLTVLVVEDDLVNLKLIVLMLRKLGYEPLTAHNGLEAVRLYEEARPGCILMDVQMPEMDGIEATRRIRLFEKEAGVSPAYISALTANVLPEDRCRCLEAGMDFFLNKPVKSQAIAELLVEAVRSRF